MTALQQPDNKDGLANHEELLQLISKARTQVETIRAAGEQLADDVAEARQPSAAKAARFQVTLQQLNGVFEELQAAAPRIARAGAAADAALQRLSPQEWQAAWAQRQEREQAAEVRRRAAAALSVLNTYPSYSPSLCSSANANMEPSAALQTVVDWVTWQTGHEVTMSMCVGGQAEPCMTAATCTQVDLRVCPALRATVVLQHIGRPRAVRVVVSAPEEALEPWGSSRHLVCRRVSAVAMAALPHFERDARRHAAHQALPPPPEAEGREGGGGGGGGSAAAEGAAAAAAAAGRQARGSGAGTAAAAGASIGGGAAVGDCSDGDGESARAAALDREAGVRALESILLWLTLFKDLYTRPSAANGQLLATDTSRRQLLPPIVRPYKLTRAQLLAYARGEGGARCPAYHAQDEPLGPLGGGGGGA